MGVTTSYIHCMRVIRVVSLCLCGLIVSPNMYNYYSSKFSTIKHNITRVVMKSSHAMLALSVQCKYISASVFYIFLISHDNFTLPIIIIHVHTLYSEQ